jgi:hypothetical protein
MHIEPSSPFNSLQRVPQLRAYRVGDRSKVNAVLRSHTEFHPNDAMDQCLDQVFEASTLYPDFRLAVADRRKRLAGLAWGHQFAGLVAAELPFARSELQKHIGALDSAYFHQATVLHAEEADVEVRKALADSVIAYARQRGYQCLVARRSAFDALGLRALARQGYRGILGAFQDVYFALDL